MYLFIFESIGTQEIILIGIVALIIFGPRKLPEIARTIGKTMADFRNVTNEFKSTWEKEVQEDKQMLKDLAVNTDLETSTISDYSVPKEDKNLLKPQIKELSAAEIESIFQKKEKAIEPSQAEEVNPDEPTTLTKRDWL